MVDSEKMAVSLQQKISDKDFASKDSFEKLVLLKTEVDCLKAENFEVNGNLTLEISKNNRLEYSLGSANSNLETLRGQLTALTSERDEFSLLCKKSDVSMREMEARLGEKHSDAESVKKNLEFVQKDAELKRGELESKILGMWQEIEGMRTEVNTNKTRIQSVEADGIAAKSETTKVQKTNLELQES
jgi:hypothetical protein